MLILIPLILLAFLLGAKKCFFYLILAQVCAPAILS